MRAGGDAQDARLPVAVHEPALRDGAERVGQAERPDDAAGLRERARRVAREQQDRQDVHPDRQRSRSRQDDRRARPGEGEQRPIAPRARNDDHAPPRYPARAMADGEG
jgi:hypothetical protein